MRSNKDLARQIRNTLWDVVRGGGYSYIGCFNAIYGIVGILAILFLVVGLLWAAIAEYLISGGDTQHVVGILSVAVPVVAFLLHKWKRASAITYGLAEFAVAVGINCLVLSKDSA